jgi:glyoxylase-like metal-dependent hydrolase (beta-lactamase superfamily II)
VAESPRLIDVRWGGRCGEIGAWLCGDVLIDCGPAASVERLVDGLLGVEPRVLLLTHIHLDHAGAAGDLVELWPELEVHVHPIGLPHLADPTKLLGSARRIYGDRLERIWGVLKPVPELNLRASTDGAEIEGFVIAHTPGHASHHVAFFRRAGGEAFPGDAAGVRLRDSDLIIPHAPPPDIDLQAWDRSLDAIAEWSPGVLCLPHFGPIEDVPGHLAAMRAALHHKAEVARSSDLAGFLDVVDSELAALDDPDLVANYRNVSPPEHSYLGLRRYWDRREATRSAAPPDEPA